MSFDVTKVSPLSKAEWDEYFHTDSIRTKGMLEDRIFDNITRVITILMELKGKRLDTWWFYGAEEGEVGEFDVSKYDVTIDCFESILSRGASSYVEDLFGPKNASFEVSWLFSSSEEIVKKVTEEQNAYDLLLDAKKKKKKDKEAKKNALIISALQKLTREEQAALGYSTKRIAKLLKK